MLHAEQAHAGKHCYFNLKERENKQQNNSIKTLVH